MEDAAERNVRRLERINRNLMIAVVILAVTAVLLAIWDFA